MDDLTRTRDLIVGAVDGLTVSQWEFRPAADRWSIATVVEHLAIVEELFVNDIIPQLRVAPAGRFDPELDDRIRAVVDPNPTFDAPERVAPTGRCTPRDALDRFLASRAAAIDSVRDMPDLREHAVDHRAFGLIDGSQWALFIAAHTERHAGQIARIKAARDFPTKGFAHALHVFALL